MRRVDRWEDTKRCCECIEREIEISHPFCSRTLIHLTFHCNAALPSIVLEIKTFSQVSIKLYQKTDNTSNDTNWFEALDLQWCMWIESFWTISISTKCKLECKGTSYCLFASAPFSSSATIHGCLGPWIQSNARQIQ